MRAHAGEEKNVESTLVIADKNDRGLLKGFQILKAAENCVAAKVRRHSMQTVSRRNLVHRHGTARVKRNR